MSRRCSGRVPAAVIIALVLAWPSFSLAADAASKAAAKDPFQVPDGTIEELQKYIDGLNKIQPSSSLRPRIADLYRQRATAQGNACEKILAAKPTPEQAQAAVRAKMAALALLGKLGDATAQDRLEATLAQVEKLGLKEMVREVQWAALANLGERAAAMNDTEYGRLVERLKGFLNDGPIDSGSARFAAHVALAAEESDRPALAMKTYRELGKIVAGSDNERVAATAATMLGAARRLDLAGKPLVLEGSTVDGRPLDWKQYRGKVVLIDFFATWCGPHRDEAPNLMKCYAAYRRRGFDVVSISIDRDRKALEDFVEQEEFPWAVLLDRNEARGTDQSLATYYGIFTIPQTILVGKDGRVLALNVRGGQLGKKLEELLGAAEAEKVRR
jgi:peroxiredoxin